MSPTEAVDPEAVELFSGKYKSCAYLHLPTKYKYKRLSINASKYVLDLSQFHLKAQSEDNKTRTGTASGGYLLRLPHTVPPEAADRLPRSRGKSESDGAAAVLICILHVCRPASLSLTVVKSCRSRRCDIALCHPKSFRPPSSKQDYLMWVLKYNVILST